MSDKKMTILDKIRAEFHDRAHQAIETMEQMKDEDPANVRWYRGHASAYTQAAGFIYDLQRGIYPNDDKGKDYWLGDIEPKGEKPTTDEVLAFCRQRINEILENPKFYGSSRGPNLMLAYTSVCNFILAEYKEGGEQ